MSDDEGRSRSQSPEDLSGVDESWMIRLSSIKTLAELYAAGRKNSLSLNPVAVSEQLFKPDPTLLDRVSLFQGDITKLEVDAIVNAANRSLLGSSLAFGGGGVDGAIHSAAGPKLLDECRTLNGCLTGESKITRGYNLPARHIIHTVGPVYSNFDKAEKHRQLESAYKTSLQVAVENEVRHVAFPSISTGIYSFPIEAATHIALRTTRNFITSKAGAKASRTVDLFLSTYVLMVLQLERVIFVVWSDKDKDVYRSLLPFYFPPGEKESSPELEETGALPQATKEVGSTGEPVQAQETEGEVPQEKAS
ncbi:hypothetical protein CVT24_000374 [Panaeolus cyanescens]|uniref:Macro domain-containing protein n=1 Tax=Panaeolus cyanescens TaxID=181874 RepID=A0A409YD08_9AGAR|nr:hypothetical protein CVT24_000374 [Panaeolus cyanescens]